jgi:ADP-heptose:LPS heptosyltransferase
VVCVHPASGNVLRQWPAEYFAQLIDLLAGGLGVHVAVIGSPDERELAEQVLANVQQRERVWSLVGACKLPELPAVMARCSLFVGNNSGPKHLAASLGVPTVAVHSNVISSEEWGPLGEHAVALRRDTACGPCYLAKPEDCHRGLTCLTGITPHEVFQVCRRFLAAQ